MIISLNQIEALAEIIEMIQDHILDDSDKICDNDTERVEWMIELLDEFFQIEVSEEVRYELLAIARKGYIVRINQGSYICFSIIPNSQYEFLIDGNSKYYYGSLEDFANLEQFK